jgi:hypothetical protein
MFDGVNYKFKLTNNNIYTGMPVCTISRAP